MVEETTNIGQAEIIWQIPEFEKQTRDRRWYIYAGIVGLYLVIFSLFGFKFWRFDMTEFNPLFLGIILLCTFILVLNEGLLPNSVDVALTDEGVVVGKKFYDYDEIKHFAIVFKPHYETKNLYFEFKSAVKQRLSVPLVDQNPLEVRKLLLKYLPEDLERTDRPLSEQLTKLLKL
ncbi:MAG: hypothetical protein WCK11_04985 [Candidatus Falkowbacteria bacterium]